MVTVRRAHHDAPLLSAALEEIAQLVKVLDWLPWRQGYESCHCQWTVLQSISLLSITDSVIRGKFLCYHAYIVFEFKDPFNQDTYRLTFSTSSYRDIPEILLLWHKTTTRINYHPRLCLLHLTQCYIGHQSDKIYKRINAKHLKL